MLKMISITVTIIAALTVPASAAGSVLVVANSLGFTTRTLMVSPEICVSTAEKANAGWFADLIRSAGGTYEAHCE